MCAVLSRRRSGFVSLHVAAPQSSTGRTAIRNSLARLSLQEPRLIKMPPMAEKDLHMAVTRSLSASDEEPEGLTIVPRTFNVQSS